MQRASFHEGRHPLRILGATQGVLVQKPFGTRYAQPIETPAPTGVTIDIERGAYFAWFEVTNTSHRKTVEVEKKLLIGNGNVPGDGHSRLAGCAPGSGFLRFRRNTAGQHRS